MSIWNLIRRHGGKPHTSKTPAVKGMPPKGARVPGVGDGRTRTNRKVKLDPPPKGGSHRK